MLSVLWKSVCNPCNNSFVCIAEGLRNAFQTNKQKTEKEISSVLQGN